METKAKQDKEGIGHRWWLLGVGLPLLLSVVFGMLLVRHGVLVRFIVLQAALAFVLVAADGVVERMSGERQEPASVRKTLATPSRGAWFLAMALLVMWLMFVL